MTAAAMQYPPRPNQLRAGSAQPSISLAKARAAASALRAIFQ